MPQLGFIRLFRLLFAKLVMGHWRGQRQCYLTGEKTNSFNSVPSCWLTAVSQHHCRNLYDHFFFQKHSTNLKLYELSTSTEKWKISLTGSFIELIARWGNNTHLCCFNSAWIDAVDSTYFLFHCKNLYHDYQHSQINTVFILWVQHSCSGLLKREHRAAEEVEQTNIFVDLVQTDAWLVKWLITL